MKSLKIHILVVLLLLIFLLFTSCNGRGLILIPLSNTPLEAYKKAENPPAMQKINELDFIPFSETCGLWIAQIDDTKLAIWPMEIINGKYRQGYIVETTEFLPTQYYLDECIIEQGIESNLSLYTFDDSSTLSYLIFLDDSIKYDVKYESKKYIFTIEEQNYEFTLIYIFESK